MKRSKDLLRQTVKPSDSRRYMAAALAAMVQHISRLQSRYVTV
jgi:hypothetical protein